MERLIIDLTYIPLKLCAKTEYKCILNILDHLSKFLFTFPIKKKCGKTIVTF